MPQRRCQGAKPAGRPERVCARAFTPRTACCAWKSNKPPFCESTRSGPIRLLMGREALDFFQVEERSCLLEEVCADDHRVVGGCSYDKLGQDDPTFRRVEEHCGGNGGKPDRDELLCLHPYGITSQSGTSTANTQQFTARENDVIGMYYCRARYYNPAWGRFISEDPARMGGNFQEPFSRIAHRRAARAHVEVGLAC